MSIELKDKLVTLESLGAVYSSEVEARNAAISAEATARAEAISAETAARTEAIANEVTARNAAIVEAINQAETGAPTKVELVSQMTDPDKNYLYIGEEQGYNSGHIYYLVDGAPVDKGVFGGTNIDNTLTISGQAADAKVTGDKIEEIKEDLSSIEKTTLRKTDMLWFIGKNVNGTGVVQSNTSAALSNVIPVSDGTRIKRVGASADSENRNLTMYVNAYENMVFKSRSILNKDGVYTVPSDVDAICFGFARSGSYGVDMTAEDIASYFGIEWHFATESAVNAEQTRNSGEYLDNLLEKFCTFGSGSNSGITYDLIDSETHSYYVHGATADSISFFNLYNGLLPGCLERGKTYFILYENTAEARNCYARFIFYDKDGGYIQPEAFGSPYAVTIPDNAFTVIFRFYVAKNQTVDTTIKFLKLVEVQEQRMTVPYIISFVDDDASATTYVERYYNSCKRNGINGNYAVITNKFESGATDPDMLLNYEDDGMGMLIHCSEQSYSVAPEWMDRDYDGCRKNLYKGMRAMQERGFVNYRYWIMPYGYVNDDFKRLAVDAGMECMISSANFTYNDMAHFDRYHIKRFSLNPVDTEGSKGNLAAIKTAIDEMQNLPSCWLIITTHFNEWGSVTWNSTVDATGYPVGYERMNEVIQYAKASGAAVLTVPEAWRYYEPILEANEQRYNKIRP